MYYLTYKVHNQVKHIQFNAMCKHRFLIHSLAFMTRLSVELVSRLIIGCTVLNPKDGLQSISEAKQVRDFLCCMTPQASNSTAELIKLSNIFIILISVKSLLLWIVQECSSSLNAWINWTLLERIYLFVSISDFHGYYDQVEREFAIIIICIALKKIERHRYILYIEKPLYNLICCYVILRMQCQRSFLCNHITNKTLIQDADIFHISHNDLIHMQMHNIV